MAETQLPTRSTTMSTDDDAVPGEDTSEVTKLFHERLQAWKHACGYLEDYITATERMHHSQSKEYEKVLKSVSHPLKEGHHFDQSLGGIAGMFDNIRSNTQGLANSHQETSKVLKGSILPIFERLHTEVKNKTKELIKGAGKGGKAVDKARAITQRHIELLGQHTAAFDSTGGKVASNEDPYVLQRGVFHRLNKQVVEENNNRNDLIAVQDSFAHFEAHILKTMQEGLGQFMQVMSKQCDLDKNIYGDMVSTAQRIPLDFEWQGFIARNTGVLIDPHQPLRSVQSINFPNQSHRATQPLIAGSLERRGKILKKYESAYYVITPSKYLHEFKTDDDFGKEPTPELSLYIPDCAVGAISGQKFAVKGKDVSKGKIGNSFSISHEIQLRAHTSTDAEQWWNILRNAAGMKTDEVPESLPNSPVVARTSETTSPTSPTSIGPVESGVLRSPVADEKENVVEPSAAAGAASETVKPATRSNTGMDKV
ncbi:hypothetical protein P152DRAFT_398303 [Eremomyces bilateralis CBS 781.70]|uniref:PH domain-containing protein n=1 Tax=Eremomyces bilateralis CBS 781.70 TaxID=1392243 RepID=A0A6G1G1N2_9PEZI|nr:uncharacterized protein P152DRAFT_398303 [Eremomyces bilateralis CBS 781.70]KAF1811892.1 hypothetical protein P152DRAFT_398303 [Eremomyces bilateralis CBS 781.70]